MEMRRIVEEVAKLQGDERKYGRTEAGGLTAATGMLERYRAAVGQVV